MILRHEKSGLLIAIAWLALLTSSDIADAHAPRSHLRSATDYAAQIPATGILTGGNLAAAIAAVATYKPKDAFDAPPKLADLEGRSFQLEGPFAERGRDVPGVLGSWSYDAVSGELTLSVRVDHLDMPAVGASREIQNNFLAIRGFTFQSVRGVTGTYVGSNAFGKTITVKRVLELKASVAAFHHYIPGEPHSADEASFKKSMALPPKEARALVSDLWVVIKGHIGPLPDGRGVMCGKSGTEPTIDDPLDVDTISCVLPSTIQDVTIETRSTKRVIAEWADLQP